MRRRQFLTRVVWSAAGSYLAFAPGCRKPRRRDSRSEPAPEPVPRDDLLTSAELATLAAACERLLPADGTPGAIDLGVPGYIERALSGSDYPRWRSSIRRGLGRLDQDAREQYAAPFAAVDATAQDALLARFQSDRVGPEPVFFRRLLHLTLEGAFSDPSHGGNRDGRGWDLIGFVPDPCGAPSVLRSIRRPQRGNGR
jgi:gluconate 2-dehydrogenase gamma chain